MHGSFPVDGVAVADHVAHRPDADEGQKYDEMEHDRYIRSCIACTTPGTLPSGNLSSQLGRLHQTVSLHPLNCLHPLKKDAGRAANACSGGLTRSAFRLPEAARPAVARFGCNQRPRPACLYDCLRYGMLVHRMESLCVCSAADDSHPHRWTAGGQSCYSHHKGHCRFSLLT
jgi:hypothetical protein